MIPRVTAALLALAVMAEPLLPASAAEARAARCTTSSDGSYPCRFVATDRAGSFEISARGKPTIILNVEEPGIAAGFANFGTRNVFLPGRYRRSKKDPACWVNDATGDTVCAR